MIARLALAALVPRALGDYSYSYETEAPSAAPTSSMAPTRTETYAPTRMTEAPSYAPTTDTYAPTMAPTATAAPTYTDAPTDAPTAAPSNASSTALCEDLGPGQYQCLMQNGQTPTEQCTAFETWKNSLTGTETSISVTAGNGATLTCSDPSFVPSIIAAIRQWTYDPSSPPIVPDTVTTFCQSAVWSIGSCNGGMEIHAGFDATICTCGNGDIRMRPCNAGGSGLSSSDWGGGLGGPTCSAPTQTFAISTTTSRRLTEKVHGPVTRAFYSWTQRQFATP